MDTNVHQRYQWAIEQMNIQPSDYVLEIGSGTGIAAGLVAEILTTGNIIALDLSKAMNIKAIKRNDKHIAPGRASFITTPIETVTLDEINFDAIFAFNVSLFWKQQSTTVLDTISKLLSPKGRLYIFHQPPTETKVKSIAEQTTQILNESGFAVLDVRYKAMTPASTSCVVAKKIKSV